MSGLKVLVFEADREFAASLTVAFRRRGCVTRVVDDGQVGLDIAQVERPDLIILAIELPKMNGFAVCNRLKKHPDLKDVPLVIVSSDSPLETFEQHSKLRTRAEDYVHKPITIDALLARCSLFVTIPPVQPSLDDDAPDAQTQVLSKPVDLSDLDSELSGLTDAAFDSIMMDPKPPAPDAAGLDPHDEFEDFTVVSNNGLRDLIAHQTSVAGAESQTAKAPAVAPVAPSAPAMSPFRAPSIPPPPAMLQGELERLRKRVDDLEKELGAARVAAHRVDELERELVTARQGSRRADELSEEMRRLRGVADDVARLTRENEDLKKGAARPAGGGVSTREFLEIREALNRKDKEILQLKDSVNGRDKLVLETRETLLQRDLEKNELEEKLLERERELAEAEDRAQAVATKQRTAAEAADEAERRYTESLRAAEAARAALEQEKSSVESSLREATAARDALDASLAAERSARAEEVSTLQRTSVEARDALAAAHALSLEAAAAEHRARITATEEALSAEHARDLEALKAQHAQTVAERAAETERARAEERLRAEEVTALKSSHERALAELTAEHARAVEAQRTVLSDAQALHLLERSEAEAKHEDELSALQAAAAGAAATALATLALTREEHARALAALEDRHAAAASEAQAQREAAAEEAAATHRRERDALTADIASLTAARDALTLKLSEATRQAARSAELWGQARRAMQIALAFSEQAEEPAREDAVSNGG